MNEAKFGSKAKPLWQEGLPEEQILAEIENLVKENIQYKRDKILGFPGTDPEPLSAQVYSEHLCHHSNNIGMSTITLDFSATI